uniref:Metallophosphoesterase domain containing 1 n=1 Tax=Papio anubis TaxID=9555 RepID=A0A8I5N604_PAPAN
MPSGINLLIHSSRLYGVPGRPWGHGVDRQMPLLPSWDLRSHGRLSTANSIIRRSREGGALGAGVRQPWFYGWGFNLPRGQALLEKWNLIPEGVDILITHGPPLGFLDWVPKKMQRVGCVELLNTVQRRVQPRLHVFGHIHEGYGVMADGTTTYVNASVCTVNYQPVNPPIVIDLPTPRNS